MSHLGIQNLQKLQNMSTGLDLTHIIDQDYACTAYLQGRMHDVNHRNSLVDGARPYEVIYSNIAGPFQNTGYDGSRYFCTFLDTATKESEIYYIKYKSKVPLMFARYKSSKECLTEGLKIQRFHSDRGREYLSTDFQLSLAEDSITFTFSILYTQQQNRGSEQLNRTLKEKA